MPQLMPLMWVSSVIMSMLIVLVLVDMFFYFSGINLESKVVVCESDSVSYKW